MKRELTEKQIAAAIRHRNRKFRKAAKAQKRVMIAKDVIERLNTGQYKADHGNWIYVLDRSGCGVGGVGGTDMLADARKMLVGNKVSCRCCAFGGLFASCTAFNNRYSVEDIDGIHLPYFIDGQRRAKNGFQGIFSGRQIQLIELAFEGETHLDLSSSDEDYWNAQEFYEAHCHKGPKGIMTAIMENIVKNKGEFIPDTEK